jgi:hypothetical protein
MRYDFDDQIQVRYEHTDCESFETWVSGEEVLTRLSSAEAEARLRKLRKLDLNALRYLKEEIPELGKERAWRTLKDQLADSVEDTLGGNIIGESLSDVVRGEVEDSDPDSQEWILLLRDRTFKAKVLELAWIQLEGSLPEDDSPEEHDDWV